MTEAERRIERYKGKCKHFTGIQHKVCNAGIVYKSLPRPIPCIPLSIPALPCASFTAYSPEEIEAKEEARNESLARMVKVFPLIAKIKKEHKGKSMQGRDPCPACGGTLHWTHAALNGHVWGKCETPGCLSWME